MLALLLIGVGYRTFVRLPYDMNLMFTMEPPADPTDAFYEDEEYEYSAVNILYNYLSYSTLRIAIFVNLVRWIILYIGLKAQYSQSMQEQVRFGRYKLAAKVALCLIVIVQYIATTI
jgi:hypothetical protein